MRTRRPGPHGPDAGDDPAPAPAADPDDADRSHADPDGAAPAEPAAERLPWEVGALLVGSFLVAAGYGIVAPALPLFAGSFGVGIAAASAVTSALPVFRVLFAPVSGRLVARVGERTMYLTGLLVVALSTGACALATSYTQLLVFRGLGGVGSTMFSISAFSLLFRLAPPGRRGRVSGLFTGGFLLGGISGPSLGSVLLAIDIRAPFVVYAVTLVIAAVVVGGLLARSRNVGVRDDRADEEVFTISAALRLPAYRAALVSSLATGWAVMGVRVALVPLFVAVGLGLSPWWTGAALTVFALSDAIALFSTSGVSDRRGRRPLILVGLACVVASTGGLALAGVGGTTGLAVLLVASVLGGAGAGLLQPAQGAAVGDLVGSRRSGGPALSGFQMSSDVGAILGPVVAGAIAQASSFPVAFGVSSAVALVALLVWLRAPETRGSG